MLILLFEISYSNSTNYLKSYSSLDFLHIFNAQCFTFLITIQKMMKINKLIKRTLVIQNIHFVTGESSIFRPLAWTRIKVGFPNPSPATFMMSWTFEHCSSIGKYCILTWLPVRIRKKNYTPKILAKEENIARVEKIWQLEQFSDRQTEFSLSVLKLKSQAEVSFKV